MPPDSKDSEIKVTRAVGWVVLIVAASLFIAGFITVAASAADIHRIAWQGGGFTCVVWSGLVFAAGGGLLLAGRMMERAQRNHDQMMRELGVIRDLLQPTDEFSDRRRNGTG